MEKIIQKIHQIIKKKKVVIPAVFVVLLSGTMVLKNCARRTGDVNKVHMSSQGSQAEQVNQKVNKKGKNFQANLEGFSFVIDEAFNKSSGLRKKIKAKLNNPYSYAFNIYHDQTCQNLIKTVEAGGASESDFELDIKSNSENSFSLKVIDENELLSECLPGPSYTHQSCPHGFVPFVDYELAEEEDFCVMLTEAKEGSDGKPYSAFDENAPWAKISPKDAKIKCLDLGEGFNLMSNDEYMKLISKIEVNPKNWLHEEVGELEKDGKQNCIYLGNAVENSEIRDTYYADCVTMNVFSTTPMIWGVN